MDKNDDLYLKIDVEKDIESKNIQFVIKRMMDVILSIIGIIVLAPLYIIIILVIKFDSAGPAIFKQKRIGKNGNVFIIYKFRTMIINAENNKKFEIKSENLENFLFQSKNDDRITKVGKFLRKTSLDEIPQLFNVFIGNMSLVGPRPEIPDIVKAYPEQFRQRLFVLPGITGLAQISGRGEIELGKTVKYDLTYIKNFSIILDIKILFLTLYKVFRREGAF